MERPGIIPVSSVKSREGGYKLTGQAGHGLRARHVEGGQGQLTRVLQVLLHEAKLSYRGASTAERYY